MTTAPLWSAKKPSPDRTAQPLGLERGRFQFAGQGIVDAGHDDQDGVGAPGAGLVDLVGVKQEILAQRGQRHRLAGVG